MRRSNDSYDEIKGYGFFSVWLEICCTILGLRPSCKRKPFKGEVFSVSSSLRPEFQGHSLGTHMFKAVSNAMVIRKEMRMTRRYVMSESCFMIVFQDVQLLVTYLHLKWHFHRHTVSMTHSDNDCGCADFLAPGAWKAFHDIMPYFMFSISSPIFGFLHWSSLYPLIDFPIERQT